MRTNYFVVIIVLMTLIATNGAAQTPMISREQAKEIGVSAEQQLAFEHAAFNKRVFDATKDFQGLKLGVGFAFSHNLGTKRVETADIVNNVVRVSDARDDAVVAVGEIHRFVTHDSGTCTEQDASGCARWGHGPFFSLQTGANDVIEAAALGYMVGFRQAADRSQSLNIGLGLALDPRVKVLGDGFAENAPPPAGETTVRYKNKSGVSIIVAVSFGF